MGNTKTVTYKQLQTIVEGPSRDRIYDACKYAFDLGTEMRATFKSDRNENLVITIVGIEHEDGSGNSFNIKGHLRRPRHSYPCRLYYNAKRRSGSINIDAATVTNEFRTVIHDSTQLFTLEDLEETANTLERLCYDFRTGRYVTIDSEIECCAKQVSELAHIAYDIVKRYDVNSPVAAWLNELCDATAHTKKTLEYPMFKVEPLQHYVENFCLK
ncbi:hypothetical protein IKF15_04075 [Candidatus Saccharibacteria bacterium]|nr:hypothetical protein [Candidatus Saccharibacteria bacterium]